MKGGKDDGHIEVILAECISDLRFIGVRDLLHSHARQKVEFTKDKIGASTTKNAVTAITILWMILERWKEYINV